MMYAKKQYIKCDECKHTDLCKWVWRAQNAAKLVEQHCGEAGSPVELEVRCNRFERNSIVPTGI